MIDFILSGARDEGESAGSADHEGEREHQGEHGPRLEVILSIAPLLLLLFVLVKTSRRE